MNNNLKIDPGPKYQLKGLDVSSGDASLKSDHSHGEQDWYNYKSTTHGACLPV